MKTRAPRNRTLICSEDEMNALSGDLVSVKSPMTFREVENKIIHQDIFDAVSHLPAGFVDLLILDPPYNLSKNYDGRYFKEKQRSDYQIWFSSLLKVVQPLLKADATVYVCSDWKTSMLIAPILEDKFFVRNRINMGEGKGMRSYKELEEQH